MIQVCIADNQPVVCYGVSSFFNNHATIQITNSFSNYSSVLNYLKSNPVNVLVVDLELEGLSSINDLKYLVKNYSKTKIVIYTNLSESMYAPNAIKSGAAAYIHKSSTLETLADTIVKVNSGAIVFNEDIKAKVALTAKQNKIDRPYRKLSNREIEVLRYFCAGKKNNEIAEILKLNEKTISTYKLRLLAKLHVTNLVDLVNKAKALDILF